ncbi:MAG: DUF1698 domain-containing protein, partial [Gammaproteobacteria bacterium]|nr:DUF1698 domain-containing protein [Gammaproteobacteria bacterium]MBU1556216.1 DUF1698 domain-containing protein [Gammaproteobacteria bacterium]
MLDFTPFYRQLASNKLHRWLETLPAQLAIWSKDALHGDFKQWQKTISNLPATTSTVTELKTAVQFGNAADISSGEAPQIR